MITALLSHLDADLSDPEVQNDVQYFSGIKPEGKLREIVILGKMLCRRRLSYESYNKSNIQRDCSNI